MHKSFPRHATVQLHTFRLDKPNRLVLRWRNEFIPAMAADGDSRCTFTLEPEGDAVRLTILHEIDKDESIMIQSVANGWPKILSKPQNTGRTAWSRDQAHAPEDSAPANSSGVFRLRNQSSRSNCR